MTTCRAFRIHQDGGSIATDLAPLHLDRIVTRVIRIAELPAAFEAYLKGAVTGRTLVRFR